MRVRFCVLVLWMANFCLTNSYSLIRPANSLISSLQPSTDVGVNQRNHHNHRPEYVDFVATLQSMVENDIQTTRSHYRRLDDDPYVWKFFIRPKDLEELLTTADDATANKKQPPVVARKGGKKVSTSSGKTTVINNRQGSSFFTFY